MSLNGWLQIALFFVCVTLLAKPMGTYLTLVFTRKRTWLDPVLAPCEHLLYRLTGVDPEEEMRWTGYLSAVLIFSCVTMLVTYAVERLQHGLPLTRSTSPASPLTWPGTRPYPLLPTPTGRPMCLRAP